LRVLEQVELPGTAPDGSVRYEHNGFGGVLKYGDGGLLIETETEGWSGDLTRLDLGS
jgi:hypothetical protein